MDHPPWTKSREYIYTPSGVARIFRVGTNIFWVNLPTQNSNKPTNYINQKYQQVCEFTLYKHHVINQSVYQVVVYYMILIEKSRIPLQPLPRLYHNLGVIPDYKGSIWFHDFLPGAPEQNRETANSSNHPLVPLFFVHPKCTQSVSLVVYYMIHWQKRELDIKSVHLLEMPRLSVQLTVALVPWARENLYHPVPNASRCPSLC